MMDFVLTMMDSIHHIGLPYFVPPGVFPNTGAVDYAEFCSSNDAFVLKMMKFAFQMLDVVSKMMILHIFKQLGMDAKEMTTKHCTSGIHFLSLKMMKSALQMMNLY